MTRAARTTSAPNTWAMRLVPQTDAEDGQPAGTVADGRQRDAGLIGGTGAGEITVVWRQGVDLVQADGIMTPHPHLPPCGAKVLHQVIGKGVVVIDEQDHGATDLTAETLSHLG